VYFPLEKSLGFGTSKVTSTYTFGSYKIKTPFDALNMQLIRKCKVNLPTLAV